MAKCAAFPRDRTAAFGVSALRASDQETDADRRSTPGKPIRAQLEVLLFVIDTETCFWSPAVLGLIPNTRSDVRHRWLP